MKASKQYWAKAFKGAFVVTAVYLLGMSFWSSDAGRNYYQRELWRDKQFHEGGAKLEALRKSLVAQGTDLESHSQYVKARNDQAHLSAALEVQSKADFTGKDAIRVSLLWAIPLLAAYFGIAALIALAKKPSRTSGLAKALEPGS